MNTPWTLHRKPDGHDWRISPTLKSSRLEAGLNSFAIVDKERIRNLQPVYFALVMATSIVATACQLEDLSQIAELLTGLNAAIWLRSSSWHAVVVHVPPEEAQAREREKRE